LLVVAAVLRGIADFIVRSTPSFSRQHANLTRGSAITVSYKTVKTGTGENRANRRRREEAITKRAGNSY
jgi:phosphoribulokinase